jgi:NAD(P)-dependent dehydrogenase (short-subunit alcohol dehydrogenase family)
MKIVVIGASGTIGRQVADHLAERHEVVRVSRRSDPPVDLDDQASIGALFGQVENVDAVVCCAASAQLTDLAALPDHDPMPILRGKLLGQVALTSHALAHLRDGGSVTLTSGGIPEATPGASIGALVNAGLDAFVQAATPDLPRGIRLNAVRPGWVRETLVDLGMDPAAGTPAADVARAYVEAVEGTFNGRSIVPRSAG